MNTLDPVNAAIAEAAAQAERLKQQAQELAPANQNSTVATYNASAPAEFEDDDDIVDGLVVDKWIRVCPDGILLDKNHTAKQAIDKPFKVMIDATMGKGYRPFFTIAWGDPTQYAKTYHNAKKGAAFDEQGRPWATVVAQAKAVDPKAYDYQTAELAMTLLEKVGELDAGKVLATSFSSSQHPHWQALLKEIKERGLAGQQVIVEVAHQMVKKGNYKPWGVYTFKLLGAHTG